MASIVSQVISLNIVGFKAFRLSVIVEEVFTLWPKTNWFGVNPPLFCRAF